MKFYRLYTSAEKEVGFVPQIGNPIFNGNYGDSNQIWNLYLKKIDETTEIPKAYINKRAKLTDIMSVSFMSGNLFISDKMRNIFEAFKTKGIQFAKTEIIMKNTDLIKSNILHSFESDYSFLDIVNCEFRLTNAMGNELYERLYFNNWEEYLNAKNKNRIEVAKTQSLDYKPLIIKNISFSQDTELDLFVLFGVHYGGVGYFVSEKLMQKMVEEKCTGTIFKEPNERYP